jgi:hypothetical protein
LHRVHFSAVAKSSFGLFALFRALKDRRPVVFDSLKAGFAVFKGSKAYTRGLGVGAGDLPELWDPKTLYISDGKFPVPSQAFTLLVTSPKRSVWSKFSHTRGRPVLVLPPMKEPEILQLRKVAFDSSPGCDEAAVKHLMAKWGPSSARNTLEKANEQGWQQDLEEVASTFTLKQLQAVIRQPRALDMAVKDERCHRLFDLLPCGALEGSTLKPSDKEFYLFHHAQLPSQYVAGLCAAAMMKASREEFLSFLHELGTTPTGAAFHGKLYERTIVAARLEHGPGKIELKRLSPVALPAAVPPTSSSSSSLDPGPPRRRGRPPKQVAPPPSLIEPPLLKGKTFLNAGEGLPFVMFESVEELAAAWASTPGNAAFMPFSPSFPVVDFILRIDGQPLLLNSTVSKSHGIKVGNKTFLAVLDAVGIMDDKTVEIPFLWVLPEDRYQKFEKPGPVEGGTTVADVAARLAQYKLQVEIPSTASPSVVLATSESDDEGSDGSVDDDHGGPDHDNEDHQQADE